MSKKAPLRSTFTFTFEAIESKDLTQQPSVGGQREAAKLQDSNREGAQAKLENHHRPTTGDPHQRSETSRKSDEETTASAMCTSGLSLSVSPSRRLGKQFQKGLGYYHMKMLQLTTENKKELVNDFEEGQKELCVEELKPPKRPSKGLLEDFAEAQSEYFVKNLHQGNIENGELKDFEEGQCMQQLERKKKKRKKDESLQEPTRSEPGKEEAFARAIIQKLNDLKFKTLQETDEDDEVEYYSDDSELENDDDEDSQSKEFEDTSSEDVESTCRQKKTSPNFGDEMYDVERETAEDSDEPQVMARFSKARTPVKRRRTRSVTPGDHPRHRPRRLFPPEQELHHNQEQQHQQQHFQEQQYQQQQRQQQKDADDEVEDSPKPRPHLTQAMLVDLMRGRSPRGKRGSDSSSSEFDDEPIYV